MNKKTAAAEPTRNAGGRPTTLTPEITEQICARIAVGNFFSTACELAGIPETTARQWLRNGQGKNKGRKGNNAREYVQFAQAIKSADALCEAVMVQEMQKAGKGDWKFHLAFLERRFPERWSRIERHVSKFSKMSEAELDDYIAAHDGSLNGSSDIFDEE